MAVQNSQTVQNFELIRYGQGLIDQFATISDDSGRTDPLVFGTVMAQVAASGQWVPWTDEAATDGTALPAGIYVGDEIPAADIAAADVTDVPILKGGAPVIVDEGMLVFEDDADLDTVIGGTAALSFTGRRALQMVGINVESAVLISGAQD